MVSAPAPLFGIFLCLFELCRLILVLWPFSIFYELPQILSTDSFPAKISENQFLNLFTRTLIDSEIILKGEKSSSTAPAPSRNFQLKYH